MTHESLVRDPAKALSAGVAHGQLWVAVIDPATQRLLARLRFPALRPAPPHTVAPREGERRLTCRQCGRRFRTVHPTQKYCRRYCASVAHARRQRDGEMRRRAAREVA